MSTVGLFRRAGVGIYGEVVDLRMGVGYGDTGRRIN